MQREKDTAMFHRVLPGARDSLDPLALGTGIESAWTSASMREVRAEGINGAPPEGTLMAAAREAAHDGPGSQ